MVLRFREMAERLWQLFGRGADRRAENSDNVFIVVSESADPNNSS